MSKKNKKFNKGLILIMFKLKHVNNWFNIVTNLSFSMGSCHPLLKKLQSKLKKISWLRLQNKILTKRSRTARLRKLFRKRIVKIKKLCVLVEVKKRTSRRKNKKTNTYLNSTLISLLSKSLDSFLSVHLLQSMTLT